MSTERRQQARKVPKDFTYIRVGEDSGGRVLNVSEQGLCFEALSPVRYTESFPFWLSFNLIDRIDGEGTVVWVDTAKRTAGIRFMDLSEFARDQIRSWINESATEEAAPALEGEGPEVIELPLGGSEVAELPLSALHSPEPVSHADDAVNARETPREFAEPAPAGEDEGVDWESEPAGASTGYSELSELVPLRRYLTTSRMQFVRGILVGVGVGAVIVLPLFKYMSLRQRDASAVEIAGATTSTVNAGSLTDAQAPKPVLDVPTSLSLASNGTRVRTNGSSQPRGNSGETVFGRQNARTPGSSGGAQGGSAVQPPASVPQNIQPAAPAPGTAGISGAENTRAGDPPTVTLADNNRQPAPAANRAAATQRADESSGTVTASTVNPGTPAPASAEVRRGGVASPPSLGGDVRPPKLVKSTTPGYPPMARTQRVSGDVQVDALVDATGKIETVKVLSGPLLLQRAAADAIRQWKYAPGMLDGMPTPMHVTVILKFRIPTQ